MPLKWTPDLIAALDDYADKRARARELRPTMPDRKPRETSQHYARWKAGDDARRAADDALEDVLACIDEETIR